MIDIVFDMDNVLINTVKAFTEINNDMFQEDVDYESITTYMMRGLTLEERHKKKLFASALLFEYMEWYPGAVDLLKRLQKDYHVVISSRGSANNIKHKIDMIRKVLPDIGIIPVIITDSPSLSLDKDCIATRILVDDNPKVLTHCQVTTLPICLKIRDWEWSKQYKGVIAHNYEELEEIIRGSLDE